MSNVIIILIAAAVFLARIIWFTVDTEHVKKWTGISFLVAIAGGLVIYGNIDASQFSELPPIAVLRTVVHVSRMFGNAGDSAHDSFVKVVGQNIFTSCFYWIVHFFAYYSVISALILVIGKDILKSFRTWLLRFRDIEIIYGIDDNTLRLGEALCKEGRVALVFVGGGSVPDSYLNRTGALVYSDPDAMQPSDKFIKRLALKDGKRRIRVSALSRDYEKNYSYAHKMMNCLKRANIQPENTELVMFARASSIGNELLALGTDYGYGKVKAFEQTELTARLLTWKYPIADVMSFDDKGRATKDIDVLMVGFGGIGQEILRKLVPVAQFEGSSLHVHIFDSCYEKVNGFFSSRYPGLLENYDIKFEAADARSIRFADYVKEKADRLSLITVEVGNESLGQEITYGIMDILSDNGATLPIYQCYDDKIIRNKKCEDCVTTSVFDKEIMYGRSLDALAKEINHYYCKEGDPEEQWKSCDYFSRMSCCASADYLSGLIRRLGLAKTPADSIGGELLENLARCEHLRWMGFHYAIGYQPMTDDERSERAELYKKDPSINLTKDVVKRRHACLIPWDKIDALSEFETNLTGKKHDYKQVDRDNVKAVCGIINKTEVTE